MKATLLMDSLRVKGPILGRKRKFTPVNFQPIKCMVLVRLCGLITHPMRVNIKMEKCMAKVN